jgi:hypothetical protein
MKHALWGALALVLAPVFAWAAPAATPSFTSIDAIPSNAQVDLGTGPDGFLHEVLTDNHGALSVVPTDGAGNICGPGSPLPCPQASGSGGGGSTSYVQSTPLGGNAVATMSVSTAVPANSGRFRVSYQVQGSGTACVSWATVSISIAGTGNASTCTGNAAFLVQAGSTYNSAFPFVPTSALSIVESSGSTLNLVWEQQ